MQQVIISQIIKNLEELERIANCIVNIFDELSVAIIPEMVYDTEKISTRL